MTGRTRAAPQIAELGRTPIISEMVGFIPRDLRRAIELFQHERARPLVQERQARKRPRISARTVQASRRRRTFRRRRASVAVRRSCERLRDAARVPRSSVRVPLRSSSHIAIVGAHVAHECAPLRRASRRAGLFRHRHALRFRRTGGMERAACAFRRTARRACGERSRSTAISRTITAAFANGIEQGAPADSTMPSSSSTASSASIRPARMPGRRDDVVERRRRRRAVPPAPGRPVSAGAASSGGSSGDCRARAPRARRRHGAPASRRRG